ncbi:MAG: amidohydrolase family protein, partial [Rikenellaceae bacterium]
TTFVDMYFAQDRVARVVDEMGIRALLTECLFDATIEQLEGNMRRAMDASEQMSRVTVGSAAHAPYTCSADVIKRCGEFSVSRGQKLTMHLLESSSEREIVEQKYGCDPVEHLRRSEVMDENWIIAHCVHLTDSDIEAIKGWGSTVVHNPQCNMKISSGIAPVAKLLEEGVNVALGTDGACSNNDLDMWEEMRSAVMLQRVATMNPVVMPAYEVLKMATVNGAKALGLEGELGVIREGALADVIVINMNRAHLQPLHNIISTLLYCVKASDVEMTIVDGRIIVEGGELLGVDMDEIIGDVNRRAQRILSELRIRN